MRTATNFRQAREAVRAFQGKRLTNLRTGMEATLSRNTLDKMLSKKAVLKSESASVHSAAVANADHLFEHATHGWSKPDRDDDPSIKAIHRFFTPMPLDGRMYMIKITVKQTAQKTDTNPLYTLEAVAFEDGDEIREWIEAAARADGVDLGKENPQRGEWVPEKAG